MLAFMENLRAPQCNWKQEASDCVNTEPVSLDGTVDSHVNHWWHAARSGS